MILTLAPHVCEQLNIMGKYLVLLMHTQEVYSSDLGLKAICVCVQFSASFTGIQEIPCLETLF